MTLDNPGAAAPTNTPAAGTGQLEEPAPATGAEAKPPAGDGTAPPANLLAAAPEPEATPFDFSKLTLPEGVTHDTFDTKLVEDFAGLISNDKLSPQERGQAFFDLAQRQVTAEAARLETQIREQWDTTQREWQTQVEALPEFKGRAAAELGEIKKVLRQHGADDAFFDAMSLTGAGNHPAVLQMLHKLIKPFREGGGVSGKTAAPPMTPEARAASLYPTMNKGT